MVTQRGRNIIFSGVMVVAFLLTALQAEASGNDPHKRMEAKHKEFYRELNVTNEQKKLLEENKSKNKEQMKSIFNDMKEKRVLMRQELQKDQLDMGKINQINGDLKNLESRMLDYRLERIIEVRKILTPEQFKKFIDKMEPKEGHFKGKWRGDKK